MSMADETTSPQMKPQDTTNFLLGGMNAKLDAVLNNQISYDERLHKLEEASWSSRWVPAIVMSVLVSVIAGVALYLITNGLTP